MKGKRERYIRCETLSMLDLLIRGYKRIGRISMFEVVNVSNIIQGLRDRT
jgi:hypothetical protein